MSAPNRLREWITADEKLETCLRLIKVGDYQENQHIELVMDGSSGRAVAFLAPNKQGLNEVEVGP